MITGRGRFNLYLLLSAVGALLTCGCHTADPENPEKKAHEKKKAEEKLAATIEIHMEVTAQTMDFSMPAPIYRAKPINITVDKAPFVTEADLEDVKVINSNGMYLLELHMNQRGTWLLEEYTTANPGKHFAVFSKFGPKLKESRWLGAPVVPRRISNGIFTFTPDASREEADLIAIGLNNVIKKVNDKSKW